MPTIRYKFADGHTEEIDVSEEVAAAFEQFQKYEKKVNRKETRRHKSLEQRIEQGIEHPAPNADMFEILEKQQREEFELRQEQRRNEKLKKRKKQLEKILTPRQAQAYFLFEYLKIKKVEIAKSMGVTEGAIRKLILKAQANLEKQRIEHEKSLLLLNAIFGSRS